MLLRKDAQYGMLVNTNPHFEYYLDGYYKHLFVVKRVVKRCLGWLMFTSVFNLLKRFTIVNLQC